MEILVSSKHKIFPPGSKHYSWLHTLSTLGFWSVCVPVFYIKQLENPRGSQPSRPDAAHLGLLQGVKCKITEVLMRTQDTSWKTTSCSWQLATSSTNVGSNAKTERRDTGNHEMGVCPVVAEGLQENLRTALRCAWLGMNARSNYHCIWKMESYTCQTVENEITQTWSSM